MLYFDLSLVRTTGPTLTISDQITRRVSRGPRIPHTIGPEEPLNITNAHPIAIVFCTLAVSLGYKINYWVTFYGNPISIKILFWLRDTVLRFSA